MSQSTELKQQVEELLNEVQKTHRYSMSRIYALYNAVFNKNEAPQSCSSCLIRKVRELKNWLETQPQTETTIAPKPSKPRKKRQQEPKKPL